MSRIGRKAVPLPKGTSVTIKDNTIMAKGPKGELSTPAVPGINLEVTETEVKFTRDNDEKKTKAFHGMVRALVNNMVTGVSSGFERNLQIVGVGYRAQVQGKKLVLNLGYSNPIEFAMPEGIEIATDGPTKISVKGIDRQKVGQVAAVIRGFRPPEPYKGKGVRYEGEQIIRKAGKAGA